MKKLFTLLLLCICIIMILCNMAAVNAQTQTWQYLGEQWYVDKVNDISVVYQASNRVIYLATQNDSLLRSSGSTISWVNKPYEHATLVAADPTNPDIVYTGKSGGGLSKSTDGGNNWSTINNGLTNLAVTKLSISPHDHNFLLVGAGDLIPPPEGGGEPQGGNKVALYKSTNGGSSWLPNQSLPNTYLTITQIVFNPANSNTIYFSGTESNGGVWKSINHSGTWGQKNNGIDNINIGSLTISPVDTNVLYAATSKGSVRIYKSTNAGDSWSTVYNTSGATLTDIKSDPSDLSIVYASTSQGVLKTTDGGSTWIEKNSGMTDKEVNAIAVDPSVSGKVYAGTEVNFYESTNSGEIWNVQSHGGQFITTSAVAVYMGTIYSLGRSTTSGSVFFDVLRNGSNNWEILSRLQYTSDFFPVDIAINPSDSNLIIACGLGYHGPTIVRSTDGGRSSNIVYQACPNCGAQGLMATAITFDPYLDSVIFVATERHLSSDGYSFISILKSTDGGGTWYRTGGSQPSMYAILANKFRSRDKTGLGIICYAGGGNPYYSYMTLLELKANSDTCSNVLPYSMQYGNVKIASLSKDTLTTYFIYDGYTSGLYKTTDGGENWTEYQPPSGQNLTFGALAHHPSIANCLYMSLYRWNDMTYRIAKSLDGCNTWNDITFNLPTNMQTVKIVFDSYFSSFGSDVYVAFANGTYKLHTSPPTPILVGLYLVDGKPKLTWLRNAEPFVDSYKIYRRWDGIDSSFYIATVSSQETTYVDENVHCSHGGGTGSTIYYYVTAILNYEESDSSNNLLYKNCVGIEEEPPKQAIKEVERPTSYDLQANYPNPFNPATTINYALPEDVHVTLKVYDVLGREVAALVDEYQKANWYEVSFDASKLPSGVYYYRLQSGNFMSIKKMLLLK